MTILSVVVSLGTIYFCFIELEMWKCTAKITSGRERWQVNTSSDKERRKVEQFCCVFGSVNLRAAELRWGCSSSERDLRQEVLGFTVLSGVGISLSYGVQCFQDRKACLSRESKCKAVVVEENSHYGVDMSPRSVSVTV